MRGDRHAAAWIVSASIAIAFAAAMVVMGIAMQRIGVVVAIVVALFIGARRGFTMRPSDHTPGALHWRLAWIATIAVLLVCETWELASRSTTVTSLVVPLLAVPVLRALALAIWVWIGLRLVQ